MLEATVNELLNKRMVDFSIDGRILTRARADDSGEAWNDRLAAVFRERVRAAFIDAGAPQMEGVALQIGVSSELDLGLLHVEKVVSDALTDVGVIRNDRAGTVRSIEVYRYRNIRDREVDHQWVTVARVADRAARISRDFVAVAAEWRQMTQLTDYALQGAVWTNPDEYRAALERRWTEAEATGSARLNMEHVRYLEELGYQDLQANQFELQIEVCSELPTFDLDNAALFALDVLALRLLEEGVVTPLDRIVGRLMVDYRRGPDAVRASVALRPRRIPRRNAGGQR